MTGYRVLVTGSRDFTDYATVLDEIAVVVTERMAAEGQPYPEVTVVHGAARGADALAARAARELHIRDEPHPADWNGGYGKAAGFIRNAEMVRAGADVCLAFYKDGAGNRGTDHCARQAEAAGLPVRRITG